MPDFSNWDDEELLDGLIVTAQDCQQFVDRGLVPEYECADLELEILRKEFLRRLALVR